MNLFQHLGPRPKRSSHKVKSTRVYRKSHPASSPTSRTSRTSGNGLLICSCFGVGFPA
ncbi:hypothetical protein CSOJ01_07945 [Colletotrichum sojae]|uniref:Uncharacterized protein n=1 Tax=Colletotrichum sojae TaxID=2175907 RepID=A0A8H6J7P5_9PEZI|nr:hypothetical protein CSOJ01_07945 [Colletotrichum sojae]